jgi:hypothetical protein
VSDNTARVKRYTAPQAPPTQLALGRGTRGTPLIVAAPPRLSTEGQNPVSQDPTLEGDEKGPDMAPYRSDLVHLDSHLSMLIGSGGVHDTAHDVAGYEQLYARHLVPLCGDYASKSAALGGAGETLVASRTLVASHCRAKREILAYQYANSGRIQPSYFKPRIEDDGWVGRVNKPQPQNPDVPHLQP